MEAVSRRRAKKTVLLSLGFTHGFRVGHGWLWAFYRPRHLCFAHFTCSAPTHSTPARFFVALNFLRLALLRLIQFIFASWVWTCCLRASGRYIMGTSGLPDFNKSFNLGAGCCSSQLAWPLALFFGAIPSMRRHNVLCAFPANHIWDGANFVHPHCGCAVYRWYFPAADSAILINIPGTPSSIASTFLNGVSDGPGTDRPGALGARHSLFILSVTLMGCMVLLFFVAATVARFACGFCSFEYFSQFPCLRLRCVARTVR